MNKKIFTSLFSLILFYNTSHAQDRVITNDKTEFKAKVTEILNTEIKYKKWENLQGPTYSLNKNKIFMIIYENGSTDEFGSSVPTMVPKKTTPIVKPKPIDYYAVAEKFYADANYDSAVENYQKAASANVRMAMQKLGLVYLFGIGNISKDYELAKQWYQKGADLGDKFSVNQLGFIYYNGYGVPVDFGVAKTYFEKAAAMGSETAMDWLGTIYFLGSGVTKDKTMAKKWYKKSCDKGNKAACDALKEVDEAE